MELAQITAGQVVMLFLLMGTGIADSDSRILTQIDGVTKFYEQYRMGALFS